MKSRRSTLSISIFAPALYVRSTVLPVTTFLSLVRTNAPPLPGLTCWNSMTFHSCPSMLRTTPLRMSAVDAMGEKSVRVRAGRSRRSEALKRARHSILRDAASPAAPGQPSACPVMTSMSRATAVA